MFSQSVCRTFATHAISRPERIATLTASNPEALIPVLSDKLASWTEDAPPLLMFALSKSLPRPVLSKIVDMLYETPAQSRVGVLSTKIPSSLVGRDHPDTPLHAVSLAAIPADRGIVFRSTIPGTARITVGRWASQKDLWKQGTAARSDRLDRTSDWRSLWGKENIDLTIPDDLAGVNPAHVHTLLFATDAYPQGLIEGLDARFPNANIMGTNATLTPFETGREHTFFYDTPQQPRRVFDNGAVGIALCDPSLPRTSMERMYEQLEPIGPRLELTSARGNIISSLDNYNAAQQFLRIILKQAPATTKTKQMEAGQVRELSSIVQKDEEFYVGIYDDEHAAPSLVVKVLSGHPMRGTISLDTETELGPAAGTSDTNGKRWAQIFRPAPTSPNTIQEAQCSASCVFLAYPGEGHVSVSPDSAAPYAQQHPNGVLELPGVFVAASERGWYARSREFPKTSACNVPYARVSLREV